MGVETGLEQLRAAVADGRLVSLCDEHGLDLVVLHGSALHDPARAKDLDLAVKGRRGRAASAWDVQRALLRIVTSADLDVMSLDRAGPVARTAALLGEPVFERTPGATQTGLLAAWSERLDTQWLRDRRWAWTMEQARA